MTRFQENILDCLKDLKGSGKFVSAHTADFIFPGLVVEGLGEIAYPINEAGAQALISLAHKAPFGKGSKTIVDPNVRDTWEIDAQNLRFSNPHWTDFLEKVIKDIKPGLGLEDYEISAHLYKMLIYEQGNFFLTHRDSEKEKGMFGTLVIELPAYHTGGELVVSFESTREIISFAQSSCDYKLAYAAFYADCEHEIMPVTSGYRVSLVYNLIQQNPGRTIAPQSIETQAVVLAEMLKAHQNRVDAEPAIILLGHQYTPENFSVNALKLNDRPKAKALLKAAETLGFYSKMCLVTSYLSGSPEEEPTYHNNQWDVSDEEMGEVYEESLSIEHWLGNRFPPLNHVSFEMEDLILSFPLNEDEPIVKESSGYQGNYGPDVMHWYHYGAIMIWSRDNNARMLLQQDTVSKLDWINYLLKNRDEMTESELAAVNVILATGLGNDRVNKEANYNIIADWIIKEKDADLLLRISSAVTQSYFSLIDPSHWLKLIQFFGAETSSKIIAHVMQPGKAEMLEPLLGILVVLTDSGLFTGLLDHQIELLPHYFSEALAKSQKTITATALRDLFWIESQRPQSETWVEMITDILTQKIPRDFIHHVLALQLLAHSRNTPLTVALGIWCREYLQRRLIHQPQPPADWKREIPNVSGHEKEWRLLKDFLESPVEYVFDYRRNQRERDDLESAIRHAVIDLKTETIKKGSPHTLRITKTQAAYLRQLKLWNEDAQLLNRIVQKTEGV